VLGGNVIDKEGSNRQPRRDRLSCDSFSQEVSDKLRGGSAIRMGIKTVAVYSDIDKGSRFVEMSDEAYNVGPAPARKQFHSLNSLFSAVVLARR
jgi:hypothetical protein